VAAAAISLEAIGLVAFQQARQSPYNEPDNWQDWIAANFDDYLWPPFAPYHEEFWDWAWSIQPSESPDPFVAIWPRGFTKSTSTEVAISMLAARNKRTYGLYVCSTQDRADDHVLNVAEMLESPAFARHYLKVSQRKVGKYGNAQGWRRNRLRTASGFTLDAIGLDTAARGAKIGKNRPDFIIFDDIDGILDPPATIKKKITTITKSLLPSRATHAAVLVVQNLIHEDGVVAQLADGRADFLANRIVSGPHPAIANLVIEQIDGKARITEGTPTWDAIDIPDLQAELDEIGESAFRGEKQHEVGKVEGSIFEHVPFRHCRWDELPDLVDIEVWVDPAVTDTDGSDAHGIQADGIDANKNIYRLYSWENRASPEEALRRAILKSLELKAGSVGVETDQGGDTWKSTYDRVWDQMIDDGAVKKGTTKPTFKQAKAGQGHGSKAHRAGQMLVDYERATIIHVVGTHETLERALRRYLIRKPYDLVDAAYWSWYHLRKSIPDVTITTHERASRWATGSSSRWRN
jgi:hypothetical protein